LFKDYLIKFFAFNSEQLKLYGYRKDVYKFSEIKFYKLWFANGRLFIKLKITNNIESDGNVSIRSTYGEQLLRKYSTVNLPIGEPEEKRFSRITRDLMASLYRKFVTMHKFRVIMRLFAIIASRRGQQLKRSSRVINYCRRRVSKVINTVHLQFANQEAHEQALDIASKIEGSRDEIR